MVEAVTEILLILSLVLINGFFAMVEIALISSRACRCLLEMGGAHAMLCREPLRRGLCGAITNPPAAAPQI